MSLKTTYSEQELVALLREKDRQAFTYLYDNYSGALFGVINSIITERETASDVLQTVFVNIWNKIDSYDAGKGRLFTWMLNIARNASIDEIRSKRYRDSRKNLSIDDTTELAAPATTSSARDVGLKRLLNQLKEEWRTLIDLSYFQGFTHEEIAKILGLPLGTVKTRIRSALSELRKMMK